MSTDDQLRFMAAIAQRKTTKKSSKAAAAPRNTLNAEDAAAVERIRGQRAQVSACLPEHLHAFMLKGNSVSNDDIVSALHGLRLQLKDPAVDWLTYEIEQRLPRAPGAPTNEAIVLARGHIGEHVRKLQREIKEAGPVRRNGRVLRVAPLDAALGQVSEITGIPTKTLANWLPKQGRKPQ